MGCGSLTNIEFSCDDRKNSAGLKSFGYVGFKEDFTFTKAIDGSITALSFVVTKQLYKFSVPQKANDAGYELQLADATGNPSYKLSVNGQFSAAEQASLNSIDDIIFATDLVFIMPSNGEKFYVYGINNGMSVETGTQTSGKTGADNNLHQLGFTGEDNVIPPEFIDTDYETSLALLEGYYLTPA